MAVGAPEHAGRRRLRRVLTAVATVVALVQVVVAVAVWLQVPAGRERGIDISTSYVAAGVWREGKGDRLYDQQLEARRHAALNVPGFRTDLPFITPPLTAVVAAPATLLGPDRGLRVLSVLAVLALAVSLLIAAGAAPHPRGGATRLALLLGIAAVPTIPLFLMGQWDGTCALGLACAYAAWRRERALLAGLALAMKERGSTARIVGVEPEGADAVRRSVAAGHPVMLDHPHSVADKLVAKSTTELNVALARRYVDELVTVTEAALEQATYDYLEGLSLLVEPSGAASLAAVRSGATRIGPKTVLVVSGGNAQPAVLARILASR